MRSGKMVATETATNHRDQPRAGCPAFEVDWTEGDVPLTVTFDAGASTDANGEIVTSYAWDFGDGETVSEGITASVIPTPRQVRSK